MLKRNISPQYLRSDKISVTIVEVKNPAHFIVKEFPTIGASSEVVKFIETEEIMQKYYASVEPSLSQLPLKNDIVIVKVDKKYFRAEVISILNRADGYVFKVYLVDYGKLCSVPRSCLYEINRDFLCHPFQAVEFKLLDVQPVSLVMNASDMTFSYGTVDSWDPSAISYIEMTQKALDQAFVVVKGVENECLVGSLYVTLCNEEFKCINEELVAKKFACYNPEGMEKAVKLKTYIQNRFLSSALSKSRLSVESSSESVKSGFSVNTTKSSLSKVSDSKETDKNSVSGEKELMKRKMTGCIAVDEDELHNKTEECSSQDTQKNVSVISDEKKGISPEDIQKNVSNSSSKLQMLMKYRSIKSSSTSIHSSTDSKKQNNLKSSVPVEDEKLKNVKSGESTNEKIQHSCKMEVPLDEQNVSNKNTTVSPTTSSSSFQTSPIKLEDLRNFLHSRKKNVTGKAKIISEAKINPKSDSLHFKENSDNSSSVSCASFRSDPDKLSEPKTASIKSEDSLEKFINEVMSDVDDPDDLLQCALDPGKKCSGAESSSPEKFEARSGYESVSLDFSKKSLWEKQKVPALCVGEAIPPAVLSVDDATFTPYVKTVLEKICFYGPSSVQSVVWPSMNRSRNLAAVAPPHSGKTIAYLLPLVSNITDGVFYKNVPKGNGPIALILCSSWKKVQAVYDYFNVFGDTKKIKVATFFADGKSKRSKVSALSFGCDILVSVPSCLLDLFKEKAVDVSRCCHFILDDGNTLLSNQIDKVTELMFSLAESIRSRKPITVPLQILICAERWTKSVSSFVDKFMISPLLLFTSFLESAIYAHIAIQGHFCSTDKNEKLLEILKTAGRTVICTSNKDSAINVHSFLNCENIKTFLVHEEMEHYISKDRLKDWKSVKTASAPYCLVITDAALIDLPISDASHLIHYDVPEVSRLQFGNRFSCIAENFTSSKDHNQGCVVHILISEECSHQATALLKIINRSGGKISKELKLFATKHSNIVKRVDAPLCNYFKTYGTCTHPNCKFRHYIDSKCDEPFIIPKEGDVHCLVTHVFDAAHYYVRILKYVLPSKDRSNKCVSMSGTYAKVGFQLKKIYSDDKNKKKVNIAVSVGENYILEDENKLFFRIKILNIIESTNNARQLVLGFQDEGWVKTYTDCQLYYPVCDIDLPPPVAVEVYLCNVQPPDSCLDWNFQATYFIQNMIHDKEIHGKIALCLRDTLWLNPIVLREKLMFVNDYLNLMTLNKALKDRGHAIENLQHLPRLCGACEGKVAVPKISDVPPPIRECIEPVDIPYAFLELNIVEDVYVSAITTPHQFYVQRAKFVSCLDELQDKINDYRQKKLLKKCQTLQKGLHCIAPFSEDNRYYRAVIIDVIADRDEVQLFYADFGDSGFAKCDMIFAMHSEFLLLPFQAIECELDGIRPAHGGWSDTTIDCLFNLTRNDEGDMKILTIEAYTKSLSYSGGNHYVVDVWNEEKSMSELLLETGLVESKDRIANSITPAVDESKEEFFDDIPPGYATSSSEELSTDEKDNRALFCAALAKIMLLGDKPTKEADEAVSKILKGVDLRKPCNFSNENIIDSNNKKLEMTSPIITNKKLSPLQALQKMLRECRKKEKKSFKPQIIWWETKDKVDFKIMVKNLKVYELDLYDLGFSFKTSMNDVDYNAEETFYSKVLSEKATTSIKADGLHISLPKEDPIKWPRLTQCNLKYIKYDLNYLDDSDSEDLIHEKCLEEKGKFDAVPYYSDECEDKEFSDDDDEEIYVKPWKNLAEFKDPFSPFS